MFFVIGALLIAAGVGLFFYNKKLANKTLEMKYLETSSCGDAISDAEKIIAELGSGNYSKMIELKGTCTSDEPLKAEFSNMDCVMYTNAVYREYEKLEISRDEQGNEKQQWKRTSTKVGGVTRHIQFGVDDGSGTVLIDPEGAEFHTEQVVKKYEEVSPNNTSFSLFGQSFSLGISGSEKTKGFRYEESIIPLKSNLYILGELHDRNGNLLVSKPQQNKTPFIVSTKSEEALTQKFESTGKFALVGGIVLIVIGIGSLIYGFIQ